jgi:hypothetical protein
VAKIRFWRWQQTDEFGMPCPTRFRFADLERKEPEQLDDPSGSLKTWNPKQAQSDIARATPPK